jgi:glucokinase
MRMKAIGIDLSRSPAIGILADMEGNILERRNIPISSTVPFEQVMQDIEKLIGKLRHTDLVGVGLGTPGWLDSKKGICHFSPNYPTWSGVDLVTPIKNKFRVPAFIINDVNSAALGEKYYGAAKSRHISSTGPIFLEDTLSTTFAQMANIGDVGLTPPDNFNEIRNIIFLSVGIGVGGGIIVDNELVIGTHEGGGELGHMTVDPDGPPCNCGNRGCIESLCSLKAIKRYINEGLKSGWHTILGDFIENLDGLNYRIIKKCIDKGDELTKNAVSHIGKYLGIGLANVMIVLDPEVIVIGGEAGEVFDTLYPGIIAELKERLRIIPYNNVKIVPAKLGELSVAYGAAANVYKKLYNF